MNQTSENEKTQILELILACLAQIQAQKNFFGGFISTSS